jgi:hypothetical protein
MIFDKIKELFTDDSIYHGDFTKALKNEDYKELKRIWNNPQLYKGFHPDSLSYGYESPTLRQLYATALTDTFTRNVVSGKDTFELFKFFIDLGIKIYDDGLLDDDHYSVVEFMVTTDSDKAGDYNKFMDYVLDQVLEYDFTVFTQGNFKPQWFKEPFLNWLATHDEFEDLRMHMYELTKHENLLPQEAKDLFLF